MRYLLASAGLVALAATWAAPAAADTEISTATTTPVKTSVLGNIHITPTGSIKLTAGGNAVTIDSNNSVLNEGTVEFALPGTGGNPATAILANPGLSGDIANKGTISIDEDYTATDSDKDGDLDGPFAMGSDRFGIHVLSGGSYTGNILNSGKITVEGNNSGGIVVDSALTGSITTTGAISVLGDNSYGLKTGAVSGNVIIGSGSTTSVSGANSVGAMIGGDVGGRLVIQGRVQSTGFRYLTPPVDPSKLDSDDLLPNGSAVVVAGDVAGGILLDAPPSNPGNTDSDGDGVPDSAETTASIITSGSAPAMVIGSATDSVTIGKLSGSDFALINRGTIAASGIYSGYSATALQIGGTGQPVTITGGLANVGTIGALAINASATGMSIGAGASVPVIVNGGAINANGGGNSASSAEAIRIASGATVNSIFNSGSITATRAGGAGTAAAIVDQSGTLTLVQNSGRIGVTNAADIGDSATAIDLRLNSTGATVRQVSAGTDRPAPLILGDVYFGSGNDTLDIQAGQLVGDVDFGAGTGIFSLGAGALFAGNLTNSAGVDVTVGNGGTFNVTGDGTIDLASLTMGDGSNLGVTIGNGTNTLYNVTGAATFGADTKILVNISSFSNAFGSFTVLDAGSLIGGENLTSTVTILPFLFNSSVTSNATDGTVQLQLSLKDNSELGLNASEATILGAALGSVDSDRPVAATLLGVGDSSSLKGLLQQMMPDYAGGAFETASKGTRLSAQFLSMPGIGKGLWMQQVAWGSAKSIGQTSSYRLGSWGTNAGYDVALGPIGSIGVTGGYYFGRDSHLNNDLSSNHYEGGLYWRGGFGPLRAYARGTVGTIDFKSTRNFSGLVNGLTVTRSAVGNWKARTYAASAGLSYETRIGPLSLRPNVAYNWFKMNEKGYSETGGGPAFDLTVLGRNSQEASVEGGIALGYNILGGRPGEMWLRVELEGGRRAILTTKIAETVASFANSSQFSLVPEKRTSGWRGAFRVLGGGELASVAAEANAEEEQGRAAIAGRLGVKIAL